MNDGGKYPYGTVFPPVHGFDRGSPGGGGPGDGSGGGPGGGSGGGSGGGPGWGESGGANGPLPRGCLFGGWRASHIDDDQARNRPPLPGVAALGLVIVVAALLVLWFIAL